MRHWKRRAWDHEFFLSPFPTPTWQERLTVPDDLLTEFTKSINPLSFIHQVKALSEGDHHHDVQPTVNRMNMFRARFLESGGCLKHNDLAFTSMPMVWDTGASFGLTPFREDFIDYEPCRIPVMDIKSTNYVIGVGTVLWKVKDTDGRLVYVPGIAYHLPTAEIRLTSPQSYHQRWGGRSELDGNSVRMLLPSSCPTLDFHTIKIPIETGASNLPMMFDVSCSKEERLRVGPKIRSAMIQHSLNFYRKFSTSVDDFTCEFDHHAKMLCNNKFVSDHSNTNLTNAQKELLLWHWKWGISMERVQELMRPQSSKDQDGKTSLRPSVIKPKFPSSSSCAIPVCHSCELARAKKRNPKVMKQQAIKEKEGILSAEKMKPGELVSMDQYVVKTPGRRYEGYGREGVENRFHGGTIFHDAASGIIRVENQVSLGAGETIGSKERFEEWLYEMAHVEVCHLHSDNGVFTAEEFRDDCKDKDQTQSFSGVGAQHQNARAERAIQTIMYMARTFMIHVSLHWNECGVDNLSLWPFAVRHAAWLYNRLPNRVTGLTPLERLTESLTDHRDISRAHVWGCPVFVLDPKLQDGKKIPKWNRRARMGQFLGYSNEHSSLVAKVRHLTTGYVSSQYHVVFDDLFHTVFGDGNDAINNAICDILWQTDREIYAEDEFDADGELIYTPPPLDDVWLSADDRAEKKARLRQQRIRREKQIKARNDSVPTTSPSKQTLPNLPEVSDDDDSLVGDSPDQSESIESEGDGWDDHPNVQPELRDIDLDSVPDAVPVVEDEVEAESLHNSEDKSQPEPPSEPPRRSNRQRKPSGPLRGLDRHPDFGVFQQLDFANMAKSNKARLSTKQKLWYACTIMANPPPMALKLSRKRSKYRQRLAYQREFGDMLLHTSKLDDQVPTIQDITKSPLSKFITFAANDCNYNGTTEDLIVNWVHPLFLKAKAAASKEDNPNYWEAMNGPFADEYWKAAVK